MTRSSAGRVVAVLGVALVALVGCSGGSSGPARAASGQVNRPTSISVFQLKPADCLDPPPDLTGEIGDIRVVPCSQPHTQEVFATVASTSSTYPGAEALATEASGSCIGAMQGPGLGLSPDDGYFVSYLLPSFDGWNKDNDRSIVCVFVFPAQGSVTGSVVEQARSGAVKPGSPPPVSAVPTTVALGDPGSTGTSG
ncbi:MAG: hypothetical protein JWM12_818 [Ilumatobacteraceae bacterium]|nr:hypothetical protein [Ilumatobacteraceae bacterium]